MGWGDELIDGKVCLIGLLKFMGDEWGNEGYFKMLRGQIFADVNLIVGLQNL